MPVQCKNCGFPNLEEVANCIACNEPMPAPVAPTGLPVSAPVESPAVPGASAATPPTQPMQPPRDPYASIEAFFPERHGELPEVAGANPEYAGEARAAMVTESTGADPWASAYDRPQSLGTAPIAVPRPAAVPLKKSVPAQRFAPSDFVTVGGVLILFVSLMMPWAEKIPGEGPATIVTAGSFPLSFLVTGFQASYALPWLTAFIILGFCGVLAVVGTVISDRPSSYLMVSSAGLASLLLPAAFLVKLATLQSEVELEGGFSHGVGLYMAIAAALVILVGATLRSNRIKSS